MTNTKIDQLTMLMVIDGCAGLVVVLIVLAVMYIILYS
jgi:hypothetical protein